MTAYYNEIDLYAAQWLRNLIAAGHIAAGDVDTRSIVEVKADDIKGYTQAHFFAGIGVWSYALRQAGWTDDRPVWTGSCPCQPFSAAGKQQGVADPRHLWPEWVRLIREHCPDTIFGEQVAAAIRQGWLDLVCADLEGLDYSIGAAVMGAHSVGAPHIRQRLYFVADSQHPERRAQHGPRQDERNGHDTGREEAHGIAGTRSPVCALADSAEPRSERARKHDGGYADRSEQPDLVGYAAEPRLQGHAGNGDDGNQSGREREDAARSTAAAGGPCNGFWRDADWLPCIDGEARPVEPGTFPLAHGAPARVGRLRAYGNAIVPQVAAEFIRTFMSLRP